MGWAVGASSPFVGRVSVAISDLSLALGGHLAGSWRDSCIDPSCLVLVPY